MSDIRAGRDLVDQLLDVSMQVEERSAVTIPAPDPEVVGPEVAGAEDIEVPARTVLTPDLSGLPEELLGPEGQPAIPAIVAYLWATVQQRSAARVRVAIGRATVTSGTLLVGATLDVAITFDAPALAVPESGWVQQQSAVAWLGRTKATIVEGSITTTGCTVRVTALNTVALSVANPIAFEAITIYAYTEPFEE